MLAATNLIIRSDDTNRIRGSFYNAGKLGIKLRKRSLSRASHRRKIPGGGIPMMLIQILKSKVHGAVITQAELNYRGSLTIDEDLMDAADMFANEHIHVVNRNNGERLSTYLIKGARGTGVCCLNGPAAVERRSRACGDHYQLCRRICRKCQIA